MKLFVPEWVGEWENRSECSRSHSRTHSFSALLRQDLRQGYGLRRRLRTASDEVGGRSTPNGQKLQPFEIPFWWKVWI